MGVEQAIFTSLDRNGKSGYHVVARSPGVTEADAKALTVWSPSHGSLIIDEANRASVNFHPLSPGRFALSRTCEGSAEYSRRGARQLYTHALIVEADHLIRYKYQLISIYLDAMALGYLWFQPEPPESLGRASLRCTYRRRDRQTWLDRARELGWNDCGPIVDRLIAGQRVSLHHRGDRIALIECLLGLLPPETIPTLSFATSLRPSSVRPFRLILLNEASREGNDPKRSTSSPIPITGFG